MIVYKIIQRTVPKYLYDYYVFVRDVHGISTRARINNIYLYRFKSVVGKNSFLYSSAVAWNELPDHLKQLQEENPLEEKLNGMLIVRIFDFLPTGTVHLFYAYRG